MAERGQLGNTLIGVGAFLIFLGVLFFLLVYFSVLPNQTWIFAWVTTYRAAAGGVFLGIILLGAGLYTRSALKRYTQKVEELEKNQGRAGSQDKGKSHRAR